MLLLYAVVPAGAPLPAGRHALRRVDVGALGAVVEPCEGRPRQERADLIGFGEVVRRLSDSGPALPVRFGTVLADDDAVAGFLQERDHELDARLRAVAGHVEVILHVADDRAPAPAPPDGSSGRDYLLSRVAAFRHRECLLTGLESALTSVASEIRRLPAGDGHRLACLVPAHRVTDVGRLADQWATDGRHVTMTGPWPVFSFAGEGLPA